MLNKTMLIVIFIIFISGASCQYHVAGIMSCFQRKKQVGLFLQAAETKPRLCGLIIWVRVFPRKTVVGDIDRSFNNFIGMHH